MSKMKWGQSWALIDIEIYVMYVSHLFINVYWK